MTVRRIPFDFEASFPRRTARSTHSRLDKLRCYGYKLVPSSTPFMSPITADPIASADTSTNSEEGTVNVILAHANGFPKELYEPFVDALLQRSPSIKAVFVHDVVGQGSSGIANASVLGDEYSWSDSSLDILAMVIHLRRFGMMDFHSPLIGLGHSMGGCHLAYASLLHHNLFCGLILIEPIIFDVKVLNIGAGRTTLASMKRRDKWPSKAIARESFLKSPFYQNWSSAVFEKWMEYGIRPTGAGEEVTLNTTVAQEVYSFTHFLPHIHTTEDDPDASTFVARHLHQLAQPTHFMFGAKSTTMPRPYRDLIIESASKSTRTDVEDCGHLIPMEKPDLVASICSDLISEMYQKWRAALTLSEKIPRASGLTQEFKQRILDLGKPKPRL